MIFAFIHQQCFTELYADDTTLYDVQDSLVKMEKNLHSTFSILHIWCRENGMILKCLQLLSADDTSW